MTPDLESGIPEQVQVLAGLLPAAAVAALEARAQIHRENGFRDEPYFAGEILRRWELADARDRWKHTGEPQPAAPKIKPRPPKPYRTLRVTINAFWYVVRLNDHKRLADWLRNHPSDAPYLMKLLSGEGK